MKKLTHSYYKAWAAQDRTAVRALLHDALVFTSPQDAFDSADSFLSLCWRYSNGLVGVRFIEEVYDGDRAFVILRWTMEDGITFAGAEYIERSEGRIKRILVVNNDPSFESLM